MGNKLGLSVGLVLLLIGAGGGYAFYARASTQSKEKAAAAAAVQPPAVPVVATTVLRQNVPIYLDGLGTVQAYYAVTVRTQINGQLIKVAFTEGQEVHKDSPIAQIDPAPYQAQLDQTKAKKLQDQAKILQDQATVKQDQAKVTQDKHNQAKDQANLDNARLDLKRDEEAGIAVSEQITGDQRALVKQLEAQIQADIAGVQADEAAIQAAEAAVEVDKATIIVDDAAIKYQQTLLDYTTITSPIEGMVGVRYIDPGNFVQTTDATGIALITQLHPISLLFTLPQQELLNINGRMDSLAKDKAKLPVLADDSTSKQKLDEGVLELVDNQIDQTTGTIKLKATFPNDKRKLWPGGFVNARLLLDTLKDATVVDASAIQQGPEGPFIYVIKEDKTVEDHPVKIASAYGRTMIQDGLAVIESGVTPGEEVVLSGQDRLKKGTKVSVHKPADKAVEKAGKTEQPEAKDSAGGVGTK